MICAEARELMLEADLVELHGHSPSPLGAHLATCAECRAAARHIIEQTAALGAVLDRPRIAKRRPFTRLVPWGLAAAATITLVIVSRGPEQIHITEPPDRGIQPAAEVSATGRNVAVFRTADPHITVVWFF